MAENKRKIALSADWVFPINSKPLRNGIVVCDEEGVIEQILDSSFKNALSCEFFKYEGAICPGFINTHCHLELSHLHGVIQEKKGFLNFAKEVVSKRFLFSQKEIQEAIVQADDLMYRNGIVAVGDISNTSDSFEQKEKSLIAYYSFIELLGLNEALAAEIFAKGKALKDLVKHPSNLVPHAHYSVSAPLMRMIADAAGSLPITIHNQESLGENEFAKTGRGSMQEFYQFLNISLDFYKPSGKSALQATLPHLLSASKILFVHNTFTTAEEFKWANICHPHLYWCTSPSSNLYIEDRLPDYTIFQNQSMRITIGTDSLASNKTLSILEELKVITKECPSITLDTLLTWATKNGADFFDKTDLGSFEKNKKPGILLITSIDRRNENLPTLSEHSTVERLY